MKYGLIGERLGHSFSKPIHEKIGGYDYELKELKKEELSSFMLEREFECLNVTIPYKTDVIPYLSYIDPVAQRIGAVNTIVNRDGELYGYNTDFGGMKMLIEKQGFDYKNKKVLILGTGGTSKTAYAVAESLGASEIIKVSRSGEVNYENLYLLHKDADYIINTTPCGMYPDNFSCPVDIDEFNCLKGVTDAVYNPIKTMLCLKAHEKGIPAEGGLYMLVAQGVLACEYFTGKSLDVKAVTDDIYSELLCEKQNIVLIGMPGSGKSTIGKALSDKMQKEFTDTDTLITEAYGEISRIFSEKGEKYFRDIESEKVKLASKSSGKVIATGGGAILRKENVLALKQNGILFFLNRPLEDIVPTSDRPLSSDYENLKKRFTERYGIYQSSADYEIHVDGVVDNAVADIMEKFI